VRTVALDVFPETASVAPSGHLVIGGCDAVELARRFGTPLYVFDEQTLRGMCRAFVGEFGRRHPQSQVLYASKAYINPALARIFQEEDLGLDVVSAGEMAIARAAGFPLERVYFHGNNKGPEELKLALEWGIGRVVVDNFHELDLLDRLAREVGKVQDVLVRVSPGVDPHTHAHTTTGILDSKFGMSIQTGQAEEAVARARKAKGLRLMGLHYHLGSPIFELEPYTQGMSVVLEFAAAMRERHGLDMRELSPGGGFAVQYTRQAPPAVGQYAEVIVNALRQGCDAHNLPLPRLVLEPGRAIVGRAGVALYTVGARKEIPGVRTYVSVDGGMGDNIRPAIYGSEYEALVANKAKAAPAEKVSIAGKYCESGDILIKDIVLPSLEPGDVLAVPASGAYCLSMASNYNASLKPPIVLVKDGEARLIRRRETFDDLLRCDVY